MITLELPEAVSVNAAYRNVAKVGRVKSTKYKRWISEAGWIIKSAKAKPIDGPYAVEIVLSAKTRKDIDNVAKATLDLLVKHKLSSDDRRCSALSIKKSEQVQQGWMRVSVTPSDPAIDQARQLLLAGIGPIETSRRTGVPLEEIDAMGVDA